MIHEKASGTAVIVTSLVLALALTTFPLPESIAAFWPEWAALVLFYWVMALPQRIGVTSAWVLGLCLDILKGALLGQHALALIVVTFLLLNMHQRIRIYPFWQQAITIGALLFIYQVLLLWIYSISGTMSVSWPYWYPSLIGIALWPWLFVLLRDLRRRYHVK